MAGKWKIVEDAKVMHFWACADGTEISVFPDFYQENGTPVDPVTGDDCVYVRTEVLIEE